MKLSNTIIAASVLLLLLPSQTAFSFGMLDEGKLSQYAEHEKITRIALKDFQIDPFIMDLIAGTDGTAGAVGSPDVIPFLIPKKRAHCDGGDFLDLEGYPYSRKKADKRLMKCQKWIFKNLDKAVHKARKLVKADGKINAQMDPDCVFNGISGRHKCNVLEKLGFAFHATQDFYSHSNWADEADASLPVSVENPPGLKNKTPASWLDPRVRDMDVPDGLISGCFLGCKGRVSHGILNKDTGEKAIEISTLNIPKGTTGRGALNNNFENAIQTAVADTQDKWKYFEDQIKLTYPGKRGELMLCVIKKTDAQLCG